MEGKGIVRLVKEGKLTEVETMFSERDKVSDLCKRAGVNFDPATEFLVGFLWPLGREGGGRGEFFPANSNTLVYDTYCLYILPRPETVRERKTVRFPEGSTGGASEDDEPEVRE